MRSAQTLPILLISTVCLWQTLRAAPPGAPEATSGKVVFALDLTNPEIRAAIEKAGGVIVNEGPDGVPSARFEVADAAAGKLKSMASFALSAEALRGARVMVTSKVRGDSIHGPDPKLPLPGYLGGKVQVYANGPSRGKRYLDAPSLHDTFPWKDAGVLCGIMDDASEVQLRIGLEGASGTFWVSELTLVLVQAKAIRATPVSPAPAQQTTQRRGFMSPQRFRAEDFADLKALRVNVVRWQMGQQSTDGRPFETWFDEELDDLGRALDAAAANGIQLVVDMHTVPGGRLPDRTYRMYVEQAHREAFSRAWQRIASRFKGHPGLWAYDLANEPVQNYPSPAGMPDWLGLQVEVAKAVRAIDPDTAIMIEVDQWDSPDSFAWLQPVDVSNVIYQAHMYWPWEFTHQGIKTNQGGADGKDFDKNSIAYPGTLDDRPLDKEALRRYLEPVRAFQVAHGARIFIGEFSAVRWAPGAARYLDDCISIFEEYGWDWTYHAFRESPVWSVEHENLPYDPKHHTPAKAPTDRLQVLQKWFAGAGDIHLSQRDVAGRQDVVKGSDDFRILFIGDSITRHGASKDTIAKLGWDHVAGMAASSETNDYAHVLAANIGLALPGKKVHLYFHNKGGSGAARQRLGALSEFAAVEPQLVVVQLGEHEKEPAGVEALRSDYAKLLQTLQGWSPRPLILCTGVWSPNGAGTRSAYTGWTRQVDDTMRAVCAGLDIPFASVERHALDPQCSGWGTNSGVKWHPNDLGMRRYADELFALFEKHGPK